MTFNLNNLVFLWKLDWSLEYYCLVIKHQLHIMHLQSFDLEVVVLSIWACKLHLSFCLITWTSYIFLINLSHKPPFKFQQRHTITSKSNNEWTFKFHQQWKYSFWWALRSRKPFGLKGTQRLSNLFKIRTKNITKGEIIAIGKDKCRAFAETEMFS